MGKIKWSSCRIISLFAALCFFYPGIQNTLIAQLEIIRTQPNQNAVFAEPRVYISFKFNMPVDSTSFTSSTVTIYGELHGYYQFKIKLDSSLTVASIFPIPAIFEGDRVQVTLGEGIKAMDGTELAAVFKLNFRTTMSFGNGFTDIPVFSDPILRVGDKQPIKLVTGDFNHDDFPDAAVINSLSNTVTLFDNKFLLDDSLKLVTVNSIPVGGSPIDIATADFDGDGELDLAVVNFSSNDLSFLWGGRGIQFSVDYSPLSVGIRPSSIAVADFNQDGLMDFAVTLFAEDRLVIYINEGNRNFTFAHTLICGIGAFRVASGDFDGDGDPDLAVINNGENTVTFFRNSGSGEWSAPQSLSLPARPVDIMAGNITGRAVSAYSPPDNQEDVIILSSNLNLIGKHTGDTGSSYFTMYEYDRGDESFVLSSTLEIKDQSIVTFDLGAIGDDSTIVLLPRDQVLDIVFPDYFTGEIQTFKNLDNRIWIPGKPNALPRFKNTRSLLLADFDRDGDNDILLASDLENRLRLIITPLRGQRNNRITTVTKDTIDFGKVFVNTTALREVQINKYYKTALSLDVSVTLDNTRFFGFSPRKFTLNSGEQAIATLTFSPKDTFSYSASAFLFSTHPLDNSPLELILRGQGVDVDFALSQDTLNFGSIPPGGEKTLPITLINKANGDLAVYGFTTSLPEYFSNLTEYTIIPAYSSQELLITFSPEETGVYQDTLLIHSNDSRNPKRYITLLGRSTRGRPYITSEDTVTAIEHQKFRYIARASDPDDDPLTFDFLNIPDWLHASSDTLSGIPPEGAQSTDILLIASDGYLRDSLDVHIRVLPVNDPPRIAPIPIQQIQEMEQLDIRITATDPEGESLQLSIAALPPGATFIDHGDNTALFRWQPAFLMTGEYRVDFIATEKFSIPALADTQTVRIYVSRRLPDLSVKSLQIPESSVYPNHRAWISATIANHSAPVYETFSVRISVGKTTIFDSTLTGMQPDTSFTISAPYQFLESGEIPIYAEADIYADVQESDESNNRLEKKLLVLGGLLEARPNPFTPNGDGKNDQVVFNTSKIVVSQPIIKIFDLRGKLIREITTIHGTTMQWDGLDNNGQELLPGVYLYLLQDGVKNVAQGYIVLAR